MQRIRIAVRAAKFKPASAWLFLPPFAGGTAVVKAAFVSVGHLRHTAAADIDAVDVAAAEVGAAAEDTAAIAARTAVAAGRTAVIAGRTAVAAARTAVAAGRTAVIAAIAARTAGRTAVTAGRTAARTAVAAVIAADNAAIVVVVVTAHTGGVDNAAVARNAVVVAGIACSRTAGSRLAPVLDSSLGASVAGPGRLIAAQ